MDRDPQAVKSAGKRAYHQPTVQPLGTVADRTLAGSGTSADGAAGMMKS